MKDRALRRHQDFKAKKKSQKTYNSCIGDLPLPEQDLENNIDKLRKICTASHLEEEFKNATKKTVQERKHDITMKEQLELTQSGA